jgi:hypothetical protein
METNSVTAVVGQAHRWGQRASEKQIGMQSGRKDIKSKAMVTAYRKSEM